MNLTNKLMNIQKQLMQSKGYHAPPPKAQGLSSKISKCTLTILIPGGKVC